ncbi:fimbrial protein [Escherichia coli]|uniref:F4 family fimbrial subunit n=1 Tax=Escherichia coli TaxID=562 RepID=UPI0038B24A0B
MNMKKTLIALAVVAASSAGVAHAGLGEFAPGALDQTVNIGGTVNKVDMSGFWEWAVGTGLDNYQNTVRDLQESNGKYVMSITNSGNTPILVGKTTQAFSTPSVGGYGAIPHITLTGSDNNTITLQPENSSNDGKYYFDLPVSSDGQNVGTARVHVIAAGIDAIGNSSSNTGEIYSAYSWTEYSIFYGALPQNNRISDGSQAATIIASFGGLSQSDALTQIQRVNANVSSFSSSTMLMAENMEYNDGTVVSASYALGIADGGKIDVSFDNPVTETIQWTAPLHITVSYL